MTKKSNPGAQRANQQHETHAASKHDSRTSLVPISGSGDHSSVRPAFPTVASATGIKYGRPPRIERIKGLVTPSHPAHSMIQIPKWQDYANDAMRLDRINFGRVR